MTAERKSPANSTDHVAWVRRVNARWIVHHGLDENAQAYLDHLAKVDPQRLKRSCRNAHLMVEQKDGMDDPKPWFYAGLFSLATNEEVNRFLAEHWLTKIVTGTDDQTAIQPGAVSEDTLKKIQRLQTTLARLPDS